MNAVIHRYDDEGPQFSIRSVSDDGHVMVSLVTMKQIEECFELGNEIEYTLDDIWNIIPIEWHELTDEYDENWIRGRVTVYDEIQQIKPLR